MSAPPAEELEGFLREALLKKGVFSLSPERGPEG